ncbi:hypothetical protein [Paracoccus sanguinis]|uniref:hypothetical protein n=1 Tax=Paracoccus sanguinis TaxID=1545044 RepID=UPI0012E05A15|nr:hypothetical protein [Paracoccus sanguinis]
MLPRGSLELPVDGRRILALASLPRRHADAFNQLLGAQALTKGIVLINANGALDAYGRPANGMMATGQPAEMGEPS